MRWFSPRFAPIWPPSKLMTSLPNTSMKLALSSTSKPALRRNSMAFRISSAMRGTTPSDSWRPNIVYVFPLPVCPYEMSAPHWPFTRLVARRKPQRSYTACCGAASPMTSLKAHLRMPMPGDMVSTEPDGPGVTESTEAVRPGPATATSPRPGAPRPSSLAGPSSSLRGPAAPHFLFRHSFIAAPRVSSGCFCCIRVTRWLSGSCIGVLRRAAANVPSRATGAGGRIRQNTDTWKRSSIVSSPFTLLTSTKRRRSGQRSCRSAWKSPSSPTSSLRSALEAGR
mmetsp:Transcript_108771/g.307645  ORF Transcript_108771/g.307645 Transcript_108771/m.307645 type:complete len:282 (-) Transcript_108771:441-1286(-)